VLSFLYDSNPWWEGKKTRYLFKRWYYYDLINRISSSKKPEAIVVVGARRTGKTTILYQLASDLCESDYSVVYIPVDELLVKGVGRLVDVVDFYRRELQDRTRSVILLDEVQYYDKWADEVKVLIDRINRKGEETNIVCTGSSALGITIGAGEALVGRSNIYQVYPLSTFEVYGLMKGVTNVSKYIWENKNELVELILSNRIRLLEKLYEDLGSKLISDVLRYLKTSLTFGGLPETLNMIKENSSEQDIRKRLSEILDLTILRDILKIQKLYPSRYNLDPDEAYIIIKLVLELSPFQSSLNSISAKTGINKEKVKLALKLAEYAGIIGIAEQYSKTPIIRARKRKFKLFSMDNGLRNSLKGLNWRKLSTNLKDLGDALENFVLSRIPPILHTVGISNPKPLYWSMKIGRKSYEVDAIIHALGKVIAIESKLSRRKTNSLNALLKYDNSIETYEVIFEEPETLVPYMMI